jgi:hypothetical protein
VASSKLKESVITKWLRPLQIYNIKDSSGKQGQTFATSEEELKMQSIMMEVMAARLGRRGVAMTEPQ